MKLNTIIDIQYSDEGGSDEQSEPVSTDEFKDFAQIETADNDWMIPMIITAARKMVEDALNISCIQRSVTITARLEGGMYALPMGPVAGNVIVTDSDSNVLNPCVYGTLFKTIGEEYCGVITIAYNAGYETLPANLKNFIMQQAVYLYDNRGDEAKQSAISPSIAGFVKSISRIV